MSTRRPRLPLLPGWISGCLGAACPWTAALLLAAGCSTVPLQKLDEETPDMRQILSQHNTSPSPTPWYERPPAEPTEWPAERFPLLPNPVLFMWVHPHLAGDVHTVPIPGYPTAFHLYEREHFALPGETPP